MLTVTSLQLNAWLAAFVWPFFRILAIIATEPLLGNRSIPLRLKIGLAALITVIVAPTLGAMPSVNPGSAAGILILVQQVVIGTAIGFSMRIMYTAMEMAGHLIGLQMGLGFATFFDPQNSAQVPVVAQFLGLLTVLVFLSLDGHLMVVMALVNSFHILPVGMQLLSSNGWFQLVQWGSEVFRIGVLLSLPVMAALLITNMSIGIMTRAAPQLNIFAVGFPITLGIGFAIFFLSLPFMLPHLERMLSTGIQMMMQIAHLARAPAPVP